MRDLSELIAPTTWVCDRCNFRDVTREAHPHTRFHPCSAMGGLTMPMLREGDRAKVTVNAREDYVGDEDVQYDGDGRPVMNVTVTRDNGQDVAVYAPTAHGGVHV